MRLEYRRWTKAKGTGGRVENPEDFVVDEIIDRRFLQTFERTGEGVRHVEGPYTLFLLRKKNMTTHQALRKIAKKLHIRVGDIGYAGLKDKFAVTTQYVTIKNANVQRLGLGSLSLEKIGATNKHISIGDLKGNRFTITLHSCKRTSVLGEISNQLAAGIPNYFGPQRFGNKRNNHVIGKLIIRNEFDKALDMINDAAAKDYGNLRDVDKKTLKFFIHAYQSWIFNETLNAYIMKNKKALFEKIPVVGFDIKIKKNAIGKIVSAILVKERISPDDFRISGLKLLCRGGERDAFIKVNARIVPSPCHNKCIIARFTLPKGCYATNIVKGMTKNENWKTKTE